MVKSIRGREVNMQELKRKNPNTIALGNTRKNAHGDIVGKNGKIIKTREQLAQEYNTTTTPYTAVNVPLSQGIPDKQAEAAKAAKKVAKQTKSEDSTDSQ